MAIPVAIAAVARLLASKGAIEATKKYGAKAVAEAKKHLRDVTTKPTKGQRDIAPVTKAQRATRDTGRKAGTAGAVGGAGATAAVMSNKDKPKAKPKSKDRAKSNTSDQRTNPKDYPTYKKGTPSSKAFKEAYRKAKKAGQKTFTWEGRRYTTD
tara:strand:- start:110 stop:571 length:462 start_codon:yes stop_codon:yes gene_type:complete